MLIFNMVEQSGDVCAPHGGEIELPDVRKNVSLNDRCISPAVRTSSSRHAGAAILGHGPTLSGFALGGSSAVRPPRFGE